jgi:endonuclease/exonuclease/phosphatase family metal-dependent hydrolase
MVLSRTPLGTPTRVATGHDSWLVDVEVPGGSLRVLAVHPVAPVDVGEWRADHRVIAEAVASADPDVVLGDFNATADHEPVQALADAGWRDVGDLADVGWQPTWPANGLGLVSSLIPPLVRIDHVLVGSRWAGLDSSTVRIADTDHLALVAEIAPRTRPGG